MSVDAATNNNNNNSSPATPVAPRAAGMGPWDGYEGGHHTPHGSQGYRGSKHHDPTAAPQKDTKLKPIRYKTKMCRHLQETGACPYLARCVFAHSAEELRTTENNETTGLTTDQALKDTQRHASMAAAAMQTLPPPVMPDGSSMPTSPVLPPPSQLHHMFPDCGHAAPFPNLQVAIPPFGAATAPSSPTPNHAASVSTMSPPGTRPHGAMHNTSSPSDDNGAVMSPTKQSSVPPTPPGYDGYRHDPYSESPYVFTKTPRAATSPKPLGA